MAVKPRGAFGCSRAFSSLSVLYIVYVDSLNFLVRVESTWLDLANDCATVGWAHAKMICSEFVWGVADLFGQSCD